MGKKFVHPDGGEGYPTRPEAEAALRKLGYVEEGYPKQMYKDGEEPRVVNGSEEESALGEDWVVFDEALRKIGGSYRERFEAARNNGEEQNRILNEYGSNHPELASRDPWYLRMLTLIPALQVQAVKKPKKSPIGFDGLPKISVPDYMATARLTDRQQDCVMLHWLHSLSVSEVSRRLDIDRSTVLEHLNLAKVKFQKDELKEAAARSRAKAKPGSLE